MNLQYCELVIINFIEVKIDMYLYLNMSRKVFKNTWVVSLPIMSISEDHISLSMLFEVSVENTIYFQIQNNYACVTLLFDLVFK